MGPYKLISRRHPLCPRVVRSFVGGRRTIRLFSTQRARRHPSSEGWLERERFDLFRGIMALYRFLTMTFKLNIFACSTRDVGPRYEYFLQRVDYQWDNYCGIDLGPLEMKSKGSV